MGDVLAAHNALTAELIRGTFRRVRPLDGNEVVVGVLRVEVERVARDGHQHGFLRVEHTARRIHFQAHRVIGLDCPADASSTRVDDLKAPELDS